MELKKRLNPKYIFIGLYCISFLIFLILELKPAEASEYEISARLNIPSIALDSDVTTLQLENRELKTPDSIVGSFSRAENKTLLIGHSSTVFENLNEIHGGDELYYNDNKYMVTDIKVLEKADVDMYDILSSADADTLEIMTCAGTDLGNGDATHRLIVTAVRE